MINGDKMRHKMISRRISILYNNTFAIYSAYFDNFSFNTTRFKIKIIEVKTESENGIIMFRV